MDIAGFQPSSIKQIFRNHGELRTKDLNMASPLERFSHQKHIPNDQISLKNNPAAHTAQIHQAPNIQAQSAEILPAQGGLHRSNAIRYNSYGDYQAKRHPQTQMFHRQAPTTGDIPNFSRPLPNNYKKPAVQTPEQAHQKYLDYVDDKFREEGPKYWKGTNLRDENGVFHVRPEAEPKKQGFFSRLRAKFN